MSTGRAELGERLNQLGIDTIVMLSNSKLRHTVLTEVVGEGVNIEHRTGSDREIVWDEYLGMCSVFGIVPSKVGYQMFTEISKIEVRMDEREMRVRNNAVIMNVDTMIMADRLRPIEKPTSGYEALQQIVELGNHNPYLISTMVSVFGMSGFSSCMSFAIDNLPVCRIPTRPVKHIAKTWQMYRSGEYPRVPGGVSHHLPEVSDAVYFYEHNEPGIGLRINSDEFFNRGRANSSTPRSLWRLNDEYYDRDGRIVRQVGLTPQTFHRVSYEPEVNLDITNAILGAPPQAFIAALDTWIRMVEGGGAYAIPFPRRKLLDTRSEIRRMLNVV